MRSAWHPVAVGAFLILGGCSQIPQKEADEAAAAVQALQTACETRFATGAEALAHAVIAKGEAALAPLKRMRKEATDPDVYVWSWACYACIKKGWDLDTYKSNLGKRVEAECAKEGGDPLPYLAHAWTLGYAPAYFGLLPERQPPDPADIFGGAFTPRKKGNGVLSHNGKLTNMRIQCQVLESGDKKAREEVMALILSEHGSLMRQFDWIDSYSRNPKTKEQRDEVLRLWKEAREYVDEPMEARKLSIERLLRYEDKMGVENSEKCWQNYLKNAPQRFKGKRRCHYEMKWPLD